MLRLNLRSGSILFCLFLSLAARSGSRAAEGPERGLADFPLLSAQRDWPWWRGPSRNGVAVGDATFPTTFSDTQNVVWKVAVPGRGHSSPIVVGNRVFLTTSDPKEQVHSVLAFDRQSGKALWQTEVSRGGFPARNHNKNTEATATIACDGEHIFATFYHRSTVQATSLDLDGKQFWQKTAGKFNPRVYEYGYAPSPLLYKGTVIISGEYELEGWLVALDRKTGEQVWKISRPKTISFSSPVVGQVAGRDQLLMSGANLVVGYDPDNGKQLWSAPGTTLATCGTLVWEDDIVVASGGFPKAETVAVRVEEGGGAKVLWKNQQKCYEQSLLIHAGYVYALTDNGIIFCWRLSDGQEMRKKRLEGPVSSSPVLAGGHIYWPNERGKWYVFRPTPKEFELVAENQLGDEAFPSPAAVAGQLFIRTATGSGSQRQEFLYCIGR